MKLPASLLNPGRRPSSDDLDWQAVGRVLWRRKLFLLSFVMVVVGLAAAYLRFQVLPIYQADVVVMLTDRQPEITPGLTPPAPPSEIRLGNQLALIASRSMAERLIQRLELYQRAEYNPALRDPGILAGWLAAAQLKLCWWLDELPLAELDAIASELLPWPLPSLAGWRENALPAGDRRSDFERGEWHQEAVNQSVREAFGAEPEVDAVALRLSFRSTDPVLARDGATMLADLYRDTLLNLKQSTSDDTIAHLRRETARLQGELATVEQTIQTVRERQRLIGPPIDEQQLSGLNSELVRTRAEHAAARARWDQLRSIDRDAAAQLLDSPVLNGLRLHRTDLETEIAKNRHEYGENHPLMRALLAKLENVTAEIDSEVPREIQRRHNEVLTISSREAALVAEIGRLQDQLAERERRESQLGNLEGERVALKSLLERLSARSKELESQSSALMPDAEIVSPAALPLTPVYPRTGLTLGVAMVAGLLVGGLVVMGLEGLDTSLRSSEQIETVLGFRSLGLIPALERRRNGHPEDYILDHPNSAFAEANRRLRTELLALGPARRQTPAAPAATSQQLALVPGPLKVVLVTSAIPGEGKSSTAMCLARVHARSGRRTLIIDCDLRRPRLHALAGVANRTGLSEALQQGCPLEAAVQPDDRSGAELVTAGAPVADPATILGGAPMRTLLDDAVRRYDLVILDCPPVLNLADTQVLAPLVDQILFIAKWASTPRSDVVLALKKLIEAQAEIAGVVLTQVDVRRHARYGYSDSGHYHDDKYTRYYRD